MGTILERAGKGLTLVVSSARFILIHPFLINQHIAVLDRRCENGDRGLGCRFCDDKEARHFTMNKKNFLTLQYLNSVTNHIGEFFAIGFIAYYLDVCSRQDLCTVAEKCKSVSNNDKNELIRLRDRCKNMKVTYLQEPIWEHCLVKVWAVLILIQYFICLLFCEVA